MGNKYNGLAVKVSNEEEFEVIKKFLGNWILYINWLTQMITTETSIIIWYYNQEEDQNNPMFSVGQVGSTEHQKKYKIRIVEFNEFFKL